MIDITPETQKVYESIEEYGPIRPSELVKILEISTKNVYKHLSRLLKSQKVTKLGETPVVYYSVRKDQSSKLNSMDPNDLLIEHNYIYVSPTGELVRGLRGFEVWVRKNNSNLEKEKKAYVASLKRLSRYIEKGLIPAKGRILFGQKNLSIDHVFYSNFDTFGHFGKTKLGQLVYVGKNSQNMELMYEIASIVKPAIENLIRKYDIGMIGYIPPTVDRKVQFMDVFGDALGLDSPRMKISKVNAPTKIPQKSLRKLEDRIVNARETIAVDPTQQIDRNVLLIDDAAGSGATLNETAKKIKKIAGGGVKVFGYAVIGSYKGFDVISEV